MKNNWKIESFLERKLQEIKNQVQHERVICGLSGGVDSSVVAAILSKAIGKKNLICIFVNHGLLRKNEEKEVVANFKKYLKSISFM